MNYTSNKPDISTPNTFNIFSITHQENYMKDKYDTLIKFDENPNITKHYFYHLIYNYFKENETTVDFDFVENTDD